MGLGKAVASLVNISSFGLIPKSTVSNMFGGKDVASTAPLPMPQAPSITDSQTKASNIIKAKRAVASQSIYTSPLGVAGEANIARKTLLGQ